MPQDALGYRKKFGVIIPSTNTIVEPDFNDMRVPGVTCHHARIWTTTTLWKHYSNKFASRSSLPSPAL